MLRGPERGERHEGIEVFGVADRLCAAPGTSTGQAEIWLMNGTTKTSGNVVGTPDTNWMVKGAEDFNGDGKSDILWQNSSTGQTAIWLMSGTSVLSKTTLSTNLGTAWSTIVGTGG